MNLKLVTIGLSHYCEKARWALDRSGLGYVEEAHPPIVHYLSTIRHRTKRSLPALLTPHGTLRDSTDILKWVDTIVEPDARLYPKDDEQRREVEALEDLFDEKLGPATRRWAYSWALHDRPLMLKLMETKATKGDVLMLRAASPLIIPFLQRGLNLSDAAIDKSIARIAQIFEDMAKRLAGKRFLVGDSLTAADLTFAALGSPVVLPSEHPLARPLDGLPGDMRRTIETMREHPAGRFIARLYREHRAKKVD
jgi:glutathione S-transferase